MNIETAFPKYNKKIQTETSTEITLTDHKIIMNLLCREGLYLFSKPGVYQHVKPQGK